ncbi:hypothetical protein AEM51_02795 [Bacteroidetes bacterium UKL13-3]|nr:hypothetical protein AEM51_02795 [Bacteroidetes bacterium UKL13-3]HCP92901.1 hypothetical protein [Bacteroidota bacterium]
MHENGLNTIHNFIKIKCITNPFLFKIHKSIILFFNVGSFLCCIILPYAIVGIVMLHLIGGIGWIMYKIEFKQHKKTD